MSFAGAEKLCGTIRYGRVAKRRSYYFLSLAIIKFDIHCLFRWADLNYQVSAIRELSILIKEFSIQSFKGLSSFVLSITKFINDRVRIILCR